MNTTRDTVQFFSYQRQREFLGKRLDSAIARVIDSGRLILDREVAELEEQFSTYCGCSSGIGVNSGTDALQVALRAAGVGEGDEVITVPNTSIATVSAIISAGAKPVFVDVQAKSMLIDPALIAGKLTAETKAIIPVHLYGQPADMDPIMALATERGLMVIEDCAQAHGADYRGRKVGSIGHAGCFSFYPTKNLGAYGDGGMIVTTDDAMAGAARMVRTYGWRQRDISERAGINSRLDEIQAAILVEKLPFLDGWNRRRHELAMHYTKLLAGLPLELPALVDGLRHVFHLFVIRTPLRDALMKHLSQRGVTTLIHYPVPIHLQPGLSHLGYAAGSFPVSEQAQNQILSLPLYPELTTDEIEIVCREIQAFFGSRV